MVYGYILILLAPHVIPLIPAFEEVNVIALQELGSNLLYLLIGVFIIPLGFYAWFQSFTTFWKNKNIRNGAIAGWNTYAQTRNIISFARNAPNAFKSVTKFLVSGKNKKANERLIGLAILIIVLAILGGYFTASAILKKADKEFDGFQV